VATGASQIDMLRFNGKIPVIMLGNLEGQKHNLKRGWTTCGQYYG